MISVEFLITSLVVVLIPGTGVIYTVSTGLVRRSPQIIQEWPAAKAPARVRTTPCARRSRFRVGIVVAQVDTLCATTFLSSPAH